jgi:hypothetical protein
MGVVFPAEIISGSNGDWTTVSPMTEVLLRGPGAPGTDGFLVRCAWRDLPEPVRTTAAVVGAAVGSAYLNMFLDTIVEDFDAEGSPAFSLKLFVFQDATLLVAESWKDLDVVSDDAERSVQTDDLAQVMRLLLPKTELSAHEALSMTPRLTESLPLFAAAAPIPMRERSGHPGSNLILMPSIPPLLG